MSALIYTKNPEPHILLYIPLQSCLDIQFATFYALAAIYKILFSQLSNP